MGNGPAGKPKCCLSDLHCGYDGFFTVFLHGYGCVQSGGIELNGLRFLSPVIVFR